MLSDKFYLIETTVGPILCGETPFKVGTNEEQSFMNMSLVHSSNMDQIPEMDQVKALWELEAIGIKDDPTENDDQKAMEYYEQNSRQLETGEYCMKWLWREEHPDLPTNASLAIRRLQSVLEKLKNNEDKDLLEKYDGIIKEQLNNNIIEEAPAQTEGLEHYIPHQPVINMERSTKIRIVYDASARMRMQKSLNDCLYRGPVILPDLAGLLMRFRFPKYPCLSDIQKAFLTLVLEEPDRNVTKFYWLKDINQPFSNENLIIYRFRKVAFGVVCSPFLLGATIQKHLRKYFDHDEFGPLAKEIYDGIYMDNVMVGCEEEDDLLKKYESSKKLFKYACMNLREFVTNSNALDQIPEEDKLNKLNPKFLGVQWNLEPDELEIKFPTEKGSEFTRRTVLKLTASTFDPLGLISPCMVPAKLFIQTLWKKPRTWDTPISPEEKKQWIEITNNWKDQSIKIPRKIVNNLQSNLQIHVFVDAAKDNYAGAAYLRSENRVVAKAENITIPRKELMAMILGVRIMKFVKNELRKSIDDYYIWGDSKTVLYWIKSDSDETKPRFIANRLQEIKRYIECTFGYVKSAENPADIMTRG